MPQAGFGDILTLLGIFGHLWAPTLLQPQPEVVEDTFAIARSLEVDCRIARILREDTAIMEVLLETVAVVRATESQVVVTQVTAEEVVLNRVYLETFNVQTRQSQEFER